MRLSISAWILVRWRCSWESTGGAFGSASAKPGTIQTGVSPGRKQGGPETEIGDAVSVGLRNSFDHPVLTKAPEVVCHFALRDVLGLSPGEDCELCPQIPIGETTRQQQASA